MPSKGHIVIPYIDPNQAEYVRPGHSPRVSTNYARISSTVVFRCIARSRSTPALSPTLRRYRSANDAALVTLQTRSHV
jgi:hypothetical protein